MNDQEVALNKLVEIGFIAAERINPRYNRPPYYSLLASRCAASSNLSRAEALLNAAQAFTAEGPVLNQLSNRIAIAMTSVEWSDDFLSYAQLEQLEADVHSVGDDIHRWFLLRSMGILWARRGFADRANQIRDTLLAGTPGTQGLLLLPIRLGCGASIACHTGSISAITIGVLSLPKASLQAVLNLVMAELRNCHGAQQEEVFRWLRAYSSSSTLVIARLACWCFDLKRQGDGLELLANVQAVISKDTLSPQMQGGLGVALLKGGNVPEARRHLLGALERIGSLQPDESRRDLLEGLLMIGECDAAVRLATRSADEFGFNPELEWLVKVSVKIERPEIACQIIAGVQAIATPPLIAYLIGNLRASGLTDDLVEGISKLPSASGSEKCRPN